MTKPTLNEILRAFHKLDTAELTEKPTLLEKFNQLLDAVREGTDYSRETIHRAMGPKYQKFKSEIERKNVPDPAAILKSKP